MLPGVPVDLPDPTSLLAVWAAGVALGAALVARWRVVGPGFLWTAAGTAVLIGFFTLPLGLPAGFGLIAVVAGAVLARRSSWAFGLFAVAAISFAAAAMTESPWFLVVSGLLALGGTTSEMLLGHWYLIDPQLPRWSLRALDAGGIAGLAADAVLVVALGGLAGAGTLAWVYTALAGIGILMMVGVWFSLREKGYEGVMAATGLSYLSVLTTLGSVALGRFLLG